jgi:hypothetical protein
MKLALDVAHPVVDFHHCVSIDLEVEQLGEGLIGYREECS